jgi:sulfite exporter TauE/SafE
MPASRPVAESRSYRTARRQESTRLHPQHESTEPSPHFDIQGSLLGNERKKTNWTLVVGQLVAYAGVALLTVGTTLIVWSYFGGPANYAPTGWLTTTAGQMLLFLGVVTLVSGGMEQTSEEVRTRIERLGERIIRIEQIARDQALRGPYIPAEYYAPTGGPQTGVDAARSTVDSRQ